MRSRTRSAALSASPPPRKRTSSRVAVNWQAEPALRDAARIVQRLGAKTCAERAGRILDWLGLEAAERCEHWQHWCEEFLTKEGKPRAPSQFASKAVTDAHPDLARPFLDECDRIIAAIDACLALKVAAVSAALMTLATPVLHAYAEHKDASGLLDYDDLIGRTSQPAGRSRRGLGAVQAGRRPRSPAAGRGAGHRAGAVAHRARADRGVLRRRDGARDAHRTVFAVGDRKQSIYSFQGADVDAFDQSHQLLRERVGAAGKPWRDATLDVSFRSTRPVLELVDRVFANPTAAAGVVDAGRDAHALRRPGGPCRRGGVVAARAAPRCGGTGAVDGAGRRTAA